MTRMSPQTTDPGRIIGHRGASRVAPENTLSAFREAARQGAYWIEFDVMLIGDGTPVIHHDATLDRCTDASGPLNDLSIADLANIHAGRLFGDAFPDERIPTLADTLDLMQELGLFANLEMKCHDTPPGLLAGAVASELERRPWANQRILVSSFKHSELEGLRDNRPNQPLALLYKALDDDWAETAGRLGAAALHVEFTALSVSMTRKIRREGLDVRIYTLNEPDLALPLRDAGLTGVITDHPPLFLDKVDWAAWANGPRPRAGQPIWRTSERSI